jgi:hypothetical protein
MKEIESFLIQDIKELSSMWFYLMQSPDEFEVKL